MKRRVYFDVEATGVDPYTDRIVELAMFGVPAGKLFDEANVPVITRINPGVPIPAEATAVHGITDDDVADAPRFAEVAAGVQAMVDGSVLVHYNGRRYDTILLDAELRRAGQAGFPRDTADRIVVTEIDLYQLWQRFEPRTLEGALKRFGCAELGDEAHGGEADARALVDLLYSMPDYFEGFDPDDDDALCAASIPDGVIDRDGKFRKDDPDGPVLFNFGPHRDRPVSTEPGFLEWMLGKDFSPETKGIARLLLRRVRPPAQGQLL